MATASDRGWSVNPDTVRVACPGIPLNLHPAVAPLFAELIRRVDAIKGAGFMQSSGGKNVRPVRGYEDRYAITKAHELLSNHSWALAADFRAATNPMSTRLITDMPPNIKQIAAECGLQWGGSYSGRKDPMHFEFIGTPAEARAAIARLTAPQEDDVLKDQTVINPISKQPETLDVTVAYLEQRIVDSIKAQLPKLVAEAVMSYPITSKVDGKTQMAAKDALAFIDRASNVAANFITNILPNRKES